MVMVRFAIRELLWSAIPFANRHRGSKRLTEKIRWRSQRPQLASRGEPAAPANRTQFRPASTQHLLGSCRRCGIGRRADEVNFQVTVLKILVSYPGGFATITDVKKDMAILATSGRDWAERTKRLGARVPDLDIFSQRLVVRENGGWRITDEGRSVLSFMEARPPIPEPALDLPSHELRPPAVPSLPHLVNRALRRRQRRARRRDARRRAQVIVS